MQAVLERLKTALRGWKLRVALSVVIVLVILLTLLVPRGGRREEEPDAASTAPVEEEPTPQVSAAPVLLTAEQAARLRYTDSVLGQLGWELSEAELEEVNRVLWAYDIREPEEVAQFLAQATIETGGGKNFIEYGTEDYFKSHGYTTGTRGAGCLHITHDYNQMAFATWMMKRYVPGMERITYCNPANNNREAVAEAYYSALSLAANLGLDVSAYSRIVYDRQSPVTTGAVYIAEAFPWESGAYYWNAAGVGAAFGAEPGVGNTDIASNYVGGSNWQSRREAYLAFYPIISGEF